MTEQQAAQADVHVATIFAETLGHDLMAAILGELRGMPDHWLRINEEGQQKAIGRLRDKVKTMVHETAQILMRGEFPAVSCELESITIKDGVRLALTMESASPMRHALYDAKGRKVLLVLADTDRWLARMDEIKAKANQLELFDEDYDATLDQPGYRRGEDAAAPAGQSWADLKKTLATKPDEKQEAKPAEPKGEEIAQGNPAVEVVTGAGEWIVRPFESLRRGEVFRLLEGEGRGPWTALEDARAIPEEPGNFAVLSEPVTPLKFGAAAEELEQETGNRGELAGLLERLWAARVTLSLGTLRQFTPPMLEKTRDWLEAFAKDGEASKIARPHFLPMQDQPKQGDDNAAIQGSS